MNDNSKLAKPLRSFTSLVRPKYSPGLLLQDDDLTTAVSYTRNLSRMLFRTLFGCGVLCGLKIVQSTQDNCGKLKFDIAKGVALSCAGDPIEVPGPQEIVIDPCDVELPCALWFAVKHTETCCVPRTAQCPPDEDEPPSTSTRERDGFEIRVFPERPPCSCGCVHLGPAQQTPPPPPPPATAVEVKDTKAVRDPKEKAKEVAGRGKSAAVAAPPEEAQPAPATPPTQDTPCPETEDPEDPPAGDPDPCLCTHRTGTGACYEPFYKGECACDCCDCDWIILAVAKRQSDLTQWTIDHSVRRFVRPVLMRDPVVGK
ncbi:MAG TPA: hypothetical protein VGQ22_23770 [Steroidobacteraceae bacterium]|jgi:hypothetical protein|nr:hypothetical protein [Steroidobacteraceae bacterium]